MIITVRGTSGNSEPAAKACALLAGMTAIVKSKRTLLIQATGMEVPSMLTLLEGKALAEREITSGLKLFSVKGFDALNIKAKTNALTRADYEETVTSLVNKKNLFDILAPTETKDFYGVMDLDAIENIVFSATEVYDYIYVLLPEREDIVSRISEKSDENVVVISQKPKDKDNVIGALDNKTVLLVNEFEFGSIYSVKFLKKEYGNVKIYTLPYNYLFRDAATSKTMLDFIMKNRRAMREDVNYAFTKSVLDMLDRYVAGINDDEEELEFDEAEERKKLTQKVPLDDLDDDSIQQVHVKKGLFKMTKHMTFNK